MLRTILVPALVAGTLALLAAAQAHGYGACHTGSTYVSPSGGVQHTGSTTASGPYGSYSGSHTSSYSGGGSSGGGSVSHSGSATASGPYGTASYSGSTTRAYSPTTYGGYSAAGTASYSGSVARYPN